MKAPETQVKTCAWCNRSVSLSQFTRANPLFLKDGYAPVCNQCLDIYCKEQNFAWDKIDELCRLLDVPFIVEEVERLSTQNPDSFFSVYSEIYRGEAYKSINWRYYHDQYLSLRDSNQLEDEIPLVREKKYAELREIWGKNYDEDQLKYLEDFYQGLKLSQNINGSLQEDQARKLCKLSLQIDELIRAGDKDVEKFMSSYDKIIKAGDFTPKNVKNASDFDSIAELVYWLEKRGWVNHYYDNATRDVIDETIKNIENYNQQLYINEGGIGEEITERASIMRLQESQKNSPEIVSEESVYGIDPKFETDVYDNEGWVIEEAKEEFDAAGGEMNE